MCGVWHLVLNTLWHLEPVSTGLIWTVVCRGSLPFAAHFAAIWSLMRETRPGPVRSALWPEVDLTVEMLKRFGFLSSKMVISFDGFLRNESFHKLIRQLYNDLSACDCSSMTLTPLAAVWHVSSAYSLSHCLHVNWTKFGASHHNATSSTLTDEIRQSIR